MKTVVLRPVSLLCFAFALMQGSFSQAATGPPEYSVVSRSASERTWSRTIEEASPSDRTVRWVEQFVELRPGGGHGYSTAYGNMLCSFNHLPFGAVGEWVWKVVGGVNPDDNQPGFKNSIIKPEPGGGITNALASFNSIHGPIVASWSHEISTNKYTLMVTVPANTTAPVYFPSTNNLPAIIENALGVSYPAVSAPGVRFYHFTNWPAWSNGAVVFEGGSGKYSFVATNAF